MSHAAGEASALAQEFVQFAIESGVLRFCEFKTKAGRMSRYFFNAGLFDDGAKLGRLAQFYATALMSSIDSRAAVPALITSSTISTRPLRGAPTRVPPSPWSLASLRL